MLMIIYAGQSARAAEYQVISVASGKNSDVYFEINLSGKVYLSIRSPPGTQPCGDFWWIKWPFGNIESLGHFCNSASFEIPGITSLAISAKLRVGGVSQPLKIVAGSTEQIAHSVSVSFP
jgi:hypothetical protein